MLLQIILEIGITFAIKIDELLLCLILNNYIAAHIADYLTIFLVGLHLIGLMVLLLDSLPATDQQIDSFNPIWYGLFLNRQSWRGGGGGRGGWHEGPPS